MQEYQQLHQGNPRDALDLMDYEVIRCDTCGAVGFEKDLVVCHKCHEGAEHIYCMHSDEQSELDAKLELCKDWTCQECMPREGTNKLVQDEVEVAARKRKWRLFESSTVCESSKGSKLKSRSLCTGKSGENGAESSAKRLLVPVKKFQLKSINKMFYSGPERSSGKTLFSGPSAIESCGQLDHRLLGSNHREPNFPNGRKKNESQQVEQPSKAGRSMSMYELWTDPDFDERTYLRNMVQFEAAYLSHHVVAPKADHKWLGKFQIHNNERIARTCDGIQAHLSNCASVEVVEAVNRLSKIVILEELPRWRTWPSHFRRSQVTEDNIALYFFARGSDSYICYGQLVNYMMDNDLALKGNLDGVELLIFPSNILPENSRCWNDMFFLWGVFRGRKVNNSSSTPVSSSLELNNGDAGKILPFDLNDYPQDGDDMAIVDEIRECEPLGDIALLGGENSNSKVGEANAKHAVIDLNVSVWPESETQENGSVWIDEDNNVEGPSSFLDATDLEIADGLMFLAKGKSGVNTSYL